jgi:L-rhamnose mutarotase
MQKLLLVIKVKPEFRKEYIDIHLNPWREMLEAIKEAGFINELIWYHDDQSIIYFECEDDDYFDADRRLRTTEACKRWDITVKPWFAAEPVMPQKIFDLNEMLEEKKN